MVFGKAALNFKDTFGPMGVEPDEDEYASDDEPTAQVWGMIWGGLRGLKGSRNNTGGPSPKKMMGIYLGNFFSTNPNRRLGSP